jgi:protein phosphatase-4 regulatory subunit 3
MSDENHELNSRSERLFPDSIVDDFEAVIRAGRYFGAFSPTSPENDLIPPMIPFPSLDNLDAVLSIVSDPSLPFSFSRERWSRHIEATLSTTSSGVSWLEQFCTTLNICEEIESVDHFRSFFEIAKHLFLFATVGMLLRLTQDDVFDSMIGALQYDSDIPRANQTNHRAFFKDSARFKQAFPLPNNVLVSRIHQNFRLQYIKDSVLARFLDDGAFMIFNQAIGYLNSCVFSDQAEGSVATQSVLSQAITYGDTSVVLAFLHSAMQAIRLLTPEERTGVMPQICSKSVFEFIETNSKSSPIAMEVLISICTLNPSFVQSRSSGIFEILITTLHQSKSESSTLQLGEVFRLILDPSSSSDAFITTFYEGGFLQQLAAPVVQEPEIALLPFTVQTIIDLIGFCVCSHSFSSKPYFLRFGSMLKAVRGILVGSRVITKSVQLSAIRLVRAFLWQKDTLYFRHLAAFNLPCLILQLLFANRPTKFQDGNMTYSACLEVVTFICVNNQIHVMESLCKRESESEKLLIVLAQDGGSKAHTELAQFMLTAVEKSRGEYLASLGSESVLDDGNSRQSITSSRGRSLSPQPLLVPMPVRPNNQVPSHEDEENYFASDDEDDLIPRTPQGSPLTNSPPTARPLKRRDSSSDAPAAVPPPAIGSSSPPQEEMRERKRIRFSTNRRSSVD